MWKGLSRFVSTALHQKRIYDGEEIKQSNRMTITEREKNLALVISIASNCMKLFIWNLNVLHKETS